MDLTWILGAAIILVIGFIGWKYYQRRKAPKP